MEGKKIKLRNVFFKLSPNAKNKSDSVRLIILTELLLKDLLGKAGSRQALPGSHSQIPSIWFPCAKFQYLGDSTSSTGMGSSSRRSSS